MMHGREKNLNKVLEGCILLACIARNTLGDDSGLSIILPKP